MKKTFNLFFVLILLLSFSSAIKISPTQQSLELNQYETICTNIWILPEADYSISSKWTFNGEGDLTKYTSSKEKLKLEINYKSISKGKYEVCFTPNLGGNLSGIIYFYDEKNMIEIGSWVDLKVKEINPVERITLLTGNAIKEYDVNHTNIGLGIVFFFLIILLFLVSSRVFNFSKNKHP